MSFESVAASFAYGGYVACLGYVVVVTIMFAVLLIAGIGENRRRSAEARIEDFGVMRSSPFTIPVSVIAPAFNEEVCISASVRSLLALDYPEHEVIVVNDGSSD